MTKKIIGSIGVLVGLGLATFIAYLVFFPEGNHRTAVSEPAAPRQVAVPPLSESPGEPANSQVAGIPPKTEAATHPEPGSAPEREAARPSAPEREAAEPLGPEAAPASSGPGAPAAGTEAAGPTLAPEAETAPPPAEPEMVSLPPLEPTEEEGLLAGRYRTFESAKKRMEKIKEQDLPAFIRPKGKFYEVWAGPFATPEEAKQARKSLQAELKISAKPQKLIIPVPK